MESLVPNYERIFKESANNLFLTDSDFHIIDGNNRTLQLLQMSKEQLLSLNLKDILPQDMLDTLTLLKNQEDTLPFDFIKSILPIREKQLPIIYNLRRFEDKGSYYFLLIITDITSQSKIEERLSDFEARYNILFEQEIVGVAEVDPKNARFIRVNDKYCQILGYSREELLELNVKAITHPDDIDKKRDEANQLLSGEISNFTMETRYMTKSDKFIWVALTVSAAKINHNRKRFFAMIHDITEFKKTQKNLAEANERLRVTQSYGHVGLWERYLDSEFAWATKEALHIWGYDRETGELHNSLITSVIDDWLNVEKDMLNQLHEKGEYISERIIHPADGSPQRYVIATAKLILDDNGNPLKVSGIVHDVTDMRKVQEQLKEVQDEKLLLAELVQQSSLPMAVGLADGKVILYNQAYCDLTGLTPEDITKTDWVQDTTPPEWKEIEMENLQKLFQTGQTVTYEKEFIRKDGKRIPIELSIQSAKGQEGKVKYYYTFITDITERKAAQQRLADRVSDFLKLFEDIDIGAAFVKCLRDEHGEPIDYRIIHANEPYRILTGLEQGKSIDPLCEILDQTNQRICFHYYCDVFMNRKPVRFELSSPVHKRTFLIRAYATEPDSLITFIKDITDVKWEGVK
ncbi:MAG TPA: PAS domain S-box protein [Candidatus Cloacimonadota bacterium]|nr:PAS domain S-box protein [Candidatus Cloacimonadota bacterium]